MRDPAQIIDQKSDAQADATACDEALLGYQTNPNQLDVAYPEPGVIELWCGSLAANEAKLKLFSSWLNDTEVERAARFKRSADSDKFKIARGTLKCILGAALQTSPNLIEFEYEKFGKPSLKNCPKLHFNLSHCERYMVMAMSVEGPIGVDVEQHNRTTNIESIARKHLSAEETAQLLQEVGLPRVEQFFALWTKKEAVVKALGTGISQSLTDLPSETDLRSDGWFIQNLAPQTLFADLASGISAAVATRIDGLAPSINVHRWNWQ